MINYEKLEERWKSRLEIFNLVLSITTKGYGPILPSFTLHSRIDNLSTPPLAQSEISEIKSIFGNPTFTFSFNYSVAKRSLIRFENICENIIEEPLSIIVDNQKIEYKFKKEDLRFYLYDENEIKIYNNDYITREFIFKNIPIYKIILLITVFDEAIEIISKYFSYDENGNEICSVEYPIGSIVSTKIDKSGDYIVQKIKFTSEGPLYGISKMNIINQNSEAFTMSDIEFTSVNEIIPNREFRINQILN